MCTNFSKMSKNFVSQAIMFFLCLPNKIYVAIRKKWHVYCLKALCMYWGGYFPGVKLPRHGADLTSM